MIKTDRGDEATGKVNKLLSPVHPEDTGRKSPAGVGADGAVASRGDDEFHSRRYSTRER